MSMREWLSLPLDAALWRYRRLLTLGGIQVSLGTIICTWLVLRFASVGDRVELPDRAALILGVSLIVLGLLTYFIGLILCVAHAVVQRRLDRTYGGCL